MYKIGKMILPEGIQIRVRNAPILFSPYQGLQARDFMIAKEPATIPVGMYVTGEDLPAGTYTLTSKEYASIWLYRDREGNNFDTMYSLEEPDFKIGKIILPEGIMICVKNASVTFEAYKGLGF